MLKCPAFSAILLAGFALAQSNTNVVIFKNGDTVRGLVQQSADGKTLQIDSENFGALKVPVERVRRMVEILRPDPLAVSPEGQRAPTGKRLTREGVIAGNLLRLLPSRLKAANIQGIKTVAIKRIGVAGLYDLDDRVFEARLISSLVRDSGWTMVERQALAILLKEQALSEAGLVEGEFRGGKMVGVDALLVVELRSMGAGRMDADFKMTTVEQGTVLWEETLFGEDHGPLKFDFGLSYGLPVNSVFSYYGTGDIPGTSGHLFGAFLELGMQLPNFFSFLELGVRAQMASDFFGSGPGAGTVLVQAGHSTTWKLKSSTHSSVYPLYLKIHPSEWFHAARDPVRILWGMGINSFSLNYDTGSMSGIVAGGSANSMILGLEICPIRSLGFQAVWQYLLSDSAAGTFVTQVFHPERSQFSFGLCWYVGK